MTILAKKFIKKFTKIWEFRPNKAFNNSPKLKKIITAKLIYL